MNKQNNINRTLLFVFTLMSFCSCQKVIDLDLNSSTPQIVVEANVSDQPDSYVVKLTKTVNYNETNIFPAVQDAEVTISDNSGNIETLNEVTPGVYKLNAKGVPGRTYILNIKSQGKEYQATSIMPTPIEMADLTVDSISFGGVTNKYVNAFINDPAGPKNFYKIIEIINGDTVDVINVFDDIYPYQDGKQLIFPVFADVDNEEDKLKSGDTVELILLCIDENVYKYYSDLIEVINDGGQSASPANPKSNISNNALGYFNASSITKKTIVIP